MSAILFKGTDPENHRLADVTRNGVYSSRLCRHGVMKWLATDYGVGQMLEWYGEYFEGEVAIFRKFLKPGDVVISAGGNIGAHLVPLSQIVGGDGRIITFEPQAFLLPVLRENLAVNGCTNVEVHEAGLGEKMGMGHLALVDPTMPNNFGGLNFQAEAGKVRTSEVPVVTVDSLELQRLDFLMLDIEGMEEEALRGSVETIARCRPLLYVEIDKEDKREPLLHFIRDELKYEVLFHLPYAFNPDNFAGNDKNHFGEIRSIMCLAVPT